MVRSGILGHWHIALIVVSFLCAVSLATLPALAADGALVNTGSKAITTASSDNEDGEEPEDLDGNDENKKDLDESKEDVIDDFSNIEKVTEDSGNDKLYDLAQDKVDQASSDLDSKDGNLKSQATDEDSSASYESTHTNMYRLYNPNSGEHFYTASLYEAKSVCQAGWRWEGIGWVAPLTGSPVYRLYNPNAGDHHYTLNSHERDNLVRLGWRYEGIGWYSDGKDQSAIYRQYNPNASAGSHNFTASKPENNNLVSLGWKAEGVAWYATNGSTIAIQGEWIITSAWGSLERYWLGTDGKIVKGRFILASEGPGYDCFATGSGAILRGKRAYNGAILLADNTGKLEKGDEGWLITGKYDNGALQRYWLVKVSGDISGAKTGLFTVGNSKYYGTPQEGYVARNTYVNSGRWYKADNNGVLTESAAPEEANMLLRAQGLSSRTNYLLLVDTNACRVGIFSGSRGNWSTVKYEACVCGASGSPTITGTYSLGYHLSALPAWPNALYATNISGGYFFHSVLSSTNELGQHLSHGCVRVNWPTAQYIQSLPTGSTVNLY